MSELKLTKEEEKILSGMTDAKSQKLKHLWTTNNMPPYPKKVSKLSTIFNLLMNPIELFALYYAVTYEVIFIENVLLALWWGTNTIFIAAVLLSLIALKGAYLRAVEGDEIIKIERVRKHLKHPDLTVLNRSTVTTILNKADLSITFSRIIYVVIIFTLFGYEWTATALWLSAVTLLTFISKASMQNTILEYLDLSTSEAKTKAEDVR